MRRPFLAGNWKMNLDRDGALALARGLKDRVGDLSDREVALFPTFVSVTDLVEALSDCPIRVGGQNLYEQDQGAFTGEISGDILRSTGAELVIIGHSERRQFFGEDNAAVNRKAHAALRHDLDLILCVGESLEQREANETSAVVSAQVQEGLAGITADQMARITIAYEPIWAIGTGRTATPETAQTVHAEIRDYLAEDFGGDVAETVRIQYGGSVKPDNVDELMSMPDIDGALVGGASLDVESFLRIVQFGG